MALDMEHDLFSAKQIEQVAVVRFKGNLLVQLTELYPKEALFEYLREVSNNRDIKVLLLFGSQEKIRRTEAIEFFRDLSQPGVDVKRISRIYNAINQLILMIRQMLKLVVHADSGEVISPFLNVSLACDYRIIGDRTVFQYPTIELGLVPKGGGVFFLFNKLGASKTLELLLSGEDIDAIAALKLGLVNKVVPSDSLETFALETAQQFAQKPLRLISGVKRLLHFLSKDLPVFLDLENQILLETIGSERFRRRLNENR
jgi:2-(1,2-epoxy-1,2-dihydrophenyl)acetyl-CoA isomerase